jgi:predicted metal-dependent hydrolase
MRSYGYGFISWLDKSLAQLIATTLLWTLVWIAFLGMIISDGTVFNIGQWYVLLVVLFGWQYDGCQVGLLRRCAIPWLDYFSPRFHPWQPGHDNKEQLKNMDKLEQQIKDLMEENESESDQESSASKY